MDNSLIIIAGGFVTLILSVNAFFMKSILKDLNLARVDIAVLIESVKNEARRVERLEMISERHEKELIKVRERLHSVEGSNGQVLSFIKEAKFS